MHSIAIVDDESFIRAALRVLLTHAGYVVSAEAGNGSDAAKIVLGAAPDVVLLDLTLPEVDGFEVAKKIRTMNPKIKIIIFTGVQGDYPLVRADQANFDGFVHKGAETFETIVLAIESVLAGKRFMSPVLTESRRRRLRNPSSWEKLLTAREGAVLGLVGLSFSDSEIAAHLGITARTAETFRSHVMHKLNIHSTAKLIRFAIDNGFSAFALTDCGRKIQTDRDVATDQKP